MRLRLKATFTFPSSEGALPFGGGRSVFSLRAAAQRVATIFPDGRAQARSRRPDRSGGVADPSPSPSKATSTEAEEKETGRVEAFSDGVFAIAMTLLVIDLLPLSERGGDVAAELSASWPTFFAFLTSFFTILVIWMNHHLLFTLIKRVDRNFLFLNGLLLLGATFVPFPTALVAQNLLTDGAVAAAVVYAATGLGLAAAFNGVWRYAAKNRRLLGASVTDEQIARINRGYWVGPAGYGTALALAFVFPVASVGLITALAIFYAIFA